MLRVHMALTIQAYMGRYDRGAVVGQELGFSRSSVVNDKGTRPYYVTCGQSLVWGLPAK